MPESNNIPSTTGDGSNKFLDSINRIIRDTKEKLQDNTTPKERNDAFEHHNQNLSDLLRRRRFFPTDNDNNAE